MSGMVGMINGDLRYNLLEATHKRRAQLRKMWMRGEIDKAEWEYRKERLSRWSDYRLSRLKSPG